MAIISEKTDVHWNYFLAIERDVDVLSRYIDFHDDNMSCFSLEITRIILAAGAETDVVCKQLCRIYDAESKAKGINQYRDQLTSVIKGLPDFMVLVPRFGLSLHPWEEWCSPKGVPLWWTAYNKIKHHRNIEYRQANLKNALNAVAGLFVVALYLYKDKAEEGTLLPPPTLFAVSKEHSDSFIISGPPTYKL